MPAQVDSTSYKPKAPTRQIGKKALRANVAATKLLSSSRARYSDARSGYNTAAGREAQARAVSGPKRKAAKAARPQAQKVVRALRKGTRIHSGREKGDTA